MKQFLILIKNKIDKLVRERTSLDESKFPAGNLPIPLIDNLPDEELNRLNQLLPWAAFVVDGKGRHFGAAYSDIKRNNPQTIPDRRIIELDRRVNLKNLSVLEIGCFEGFHTIALAQRAKHVMACDSRIENVVKTIVRCAMYETTPYVFYWDAEIAPPSNLSLECDVLHHCGVLYHLTDPVAHLKTLLPHVRKAVMLDTHIASENAAGQSYQSCGKTYRYHHYKEAGRDAPFAGMLDHAKWLFKHDLLCLLQESGFTSIDVASLKEERNGFRILIYATREKV